MVERLKAELQDPGNWIRSILSAFLSGGALVVTTAYVDPTYVNLFTDDGFRHLWQLFISGGVLGVVNLWVRSPKDQSNG